MKLCRAGCASAADLDALGAELAEIKPEGDDWPGILAWALANADGDTGCRTHAPLTATSSPREPRSDGGRCGDTPRNGR